MIEDHDTIKQTNKQTKTIGLAKKLVVDQLPKPVLIRLPEHPDQPCEEQKYLLLCHPPNQ